MKLHVVVGAQVLIVASLVSACGDSGDGAGGATAGTSNATSATGSSATSAGSSGLMGSCYGPMTHVCTMGDSTLPAEMCTAAGETPGTTCPTADLIGCCLVKAGGFTGENCYYPGSGIDALAGKANCKQQGGTWTSTP